jgi:hypothetical protein
VRRPWFRRWGWIHRPVSPQGLVVVLLLVIFWIQVFLAVDRHSHSVSDTLYGVFPYAVPGFLLVEWLASRTSDDPS